MADRILGNLRSEPGGDIEEKKRAIAVRRADVGDGVDEGRPLGPHVAAHGDEAEALDRHAEQQEERDPRARPR
jgi:hypothetical protein